jgi:hypothetical protein
MILQTFSSSLKIAKSTFLKIIFLSVSLVALGAAPVYAEQAAQPVSTQQLQLIHVPGQGDYVQSTDGKSGSHPNVFSELKPVEGTGWVAATSFDAPYTHQCLKSKGNTCDVEVEGKRVSSSGFLDDLLKNLPDSDTGDKGDIIGGLPDMTDPNTGAYLQCLSEHQNLGRSYEDAKSACAIFLR